MHTKCTAFGTKKGPNFFQFAASAKVHRSNLYGCKKIYSTVFGTKKDQNCYGAVFLSLYDLISKSPMQSCTDCKKSKAMNCNFGNSVRTIYLQSYLQVAKWYSLQTFLVTDQIDFSMKNDQSLHTFRPGNQSVLSSQNFQVVDQNVFSQQPLGVIYQSVLSRQIQSV